MYKTVISIVMKRKTLDEDTFDIPNALLLTPHSEKGLKIRKKK